MWGAVWGRKHGVSLWWGSGGLCEGRGRRVPGSRTQWVSVDSRQLPQDLEELLVSAEGRVLTALLTSPSPGEHAAQQIVSGLQGPLVRQRFIGSRNATNQRRWLLQQK